MKTPMEATRSALGRAGRRLVRAASSSSLSLPRGRGVGARLVGGVALVVRVDLAQEILQRRHGERVELLHAAHVDRHAHAACLRVDAPGALEQVVQLPTHVHVQPRVGHLQHDRRLDHALRATLAAALAVLQLVEELGPAIRRRRIHLLPLGAELAAELPVRHAAQDLLPPLLASRATQGATRGAMSTRTTLARTPAPQRLAGRCLSSAPCAR